MNANNAIITDNANNEESWEGGNVVGIDGVDGAAGIHIIGVAD